MRRLLSLAAFLLVFALVSMSAQRGGARAGFGGHSGGMGHFSGGRAFGGPHSGGGFRFSGGGFGGPRFRDHGFHRCWGCRERFSFPWYGYGGYYGGYYDPFWLWNSSSSYDYDQEREEELANQQNALNLREQELREREDWQRDREEHDAYARRPPAHSEASANPEPATVLVFRDQHQQEITNYAISGSTLWVLNDHLVAKKIPLTELDLTATAKANDERGVEFQVPK